MIAGGQAGVGRDDAREPLRVLGRQPQPDQPAPVLADEGDLAQVEDVEHQGPHPLDVAGVAVVLDAGRLVRAAEADQVGRDRPQPGVGQDGQQRAVEERPGRLAVQQQHHLAVGRARLDPGHSQRARPRRRARPRSAARSRSRAASRTGRPASAASPCLRNLPTTRSDGMPRTPMARCGRYDDDGGDLVRRGLPVVLHRQAPVRGGAGPLRAPRRGRAGVAQFPARSRRRTEPGRAGRLRRAPRAQVRRAGGAGAVDDRPDDRHRRRARAWSSGSTWRGRATPSTPTGCCTWPPPTAGRTS